MQFARRLAGTGQGVNWRLALIHRSGWRGPGQCPLHPDLPSQPGPWFLLPLSVHPEAWLPVCTAQHTCISYLRSEESPQDSLGSQTLRQGRLSHLAEPGRRVGMALLGNRTAHPPPCEVWCERSQQLLPVEKYPFIFLGACNSTTGTSFLILLCYKLSSERIHRGREDLVQK